MRLGTSRPAFINRNSGWPSFSSVSLNLGNAHAGATAQIRFRIGADGSTGAPGWDIDNIAFSGIVGTPFSGLTGDAGCAP